MLHAINRQLTDATGSYVRSAIFRAAWASFRREPWLPLSRHLHDYWRGARFEREDCQDKVRRNAAWAERQVAETAHAEMLAATHTREVLAFLRDKYFWQPDSYTRASRLPIIKRALQIAEEREHALAAE